VSATILIVDDDAANRSVLVSLLGYLGHRVVEAADGREALALAQRERPSLVITDLLMPVMDGFDLARRLREDVALAAVPVSSTRRRTWSPTPGPSRTRAGSGTS